MKIDLTKAQCRELSDVLQNGCRGFRFADYTTRRGRILKRIYEQIKLREGYCALRDGSLTRGRK